MCVENACNPLPGIPAARPPLLFRGPSDPPPRCCALSSESQVNDRVKDTSQGLSDSPQPRALSSLTPPLSLTWAWILTRLGPFDHTSPHDAPSLTPSPHLPFSLTSSSLSSPHATCVSFKRHFRGQILCAAFSLRQPFRGSEVPWRPALLTFPFLCLTELQE